jgi:hypothetical protein
MVRQYPSIAHMIVACALSVAFPSVCLAQEDYAEVPTTTTHNSNDTTTLQGSVGGPTFAAREDDPGCTPGVIFGSTCRRICGDLPLGRRYVGVVSQDINPGGWARFGEVEVYDNRTPVRTCFRVKNWAQTANRIFTVTLRHAPVSGAATTNTTTASTGVLRVRSDFVYNYAATNTRMNWRRITSGWIEDRAPGSDFPPIMFTETGRTTVDGNTGTVVRAGDREMDVFIPDVGAQGTRPDWLRQRHGATKWEWVLLGQIVGPK